MDTKMIVTDLDGTLLRIDKTVNPYRKSPVRASNAGREFFMVSRLTQ